MHPVQKKIKEILSRHIHIKQHSKMFDCVRAKITGFGEGLYLELPDNKWTYVTIDHGYYGETSIGTSEPHERDARDIFESIGLLTRDEIQEYSKFEEKAQFELNKPHRLARLKQDADTHGFKLVKKNRK